MASTYDQSEAAIRDYQAVFGKYTEQAYELTNKIAAIDLTTPTALEQVTALKEQWKVFSVEYNKATSESAALAASVINDLPADGLFSSKKKDLVTQFSQIQKVFTESNKTLVATQKDIQSKIAQLEAAAAKKTPETPKDDGSDPYVSNGQSTIAAPPTDDGGVDPYVSNGETTIPPAAEGTDAPSSKDDSGSAPLTPAEDKSKSTTPDFTINAQPNPLSKLSSYAYSLVLYMVTPDVMNQFVSNGGKLKGIDLKKGVYLVTQSGGINNSVDRRIPNNTTALKAENGGIGLDYYIDDLTLKTLLPGGPQKATVGTTISFKIIEPLGFTFLQDLARASRQLNIESTLKGDTSANGFKQPYILGIKFYGYDVDGKQITAEHPDFKKYDLTSSDNNSVAERYFSIMFSDVKFKLDGRAVTYDCNALVLGEQKAYGRINATIPGAFSLYGSTVGEILSSSNSKSNTKKVRGLMEVLSEYQQSQKDRENIDSPNVYSIEFLDDAGKLAPDSEIPSSKLIDDTTFLQSVAPMSNTQNIDAGTIATQFSATSYEINSKSVAVTAGQNVINIIDNIIVKSDYVSDALTKINTQRTETKTLDNAATKELKWYSINPVVKFNNYDSKKNNWSYDVTYQIRRYNIPYVPSVYATQLTRYPGAYKFYNYWLSGENSEVISYTQTYDNLYYTTAALSTSGDTDVDGAGKGNAPVEQTKSGTDSNTGKQNNGSEINDHVRAQLYGVDQMQAKIKILGDPDYIMSTVGVNQTGLRGLYGSDGSISPFMGQVFIQMAFGIASDYQANGLLDVSDNLQFYKTDRVNKAGIKGIVYMVNEVESNFSKGTFTQTLDCLMVDESRLLIAKKDGSSSTGDTTTSPSASNDPNEKTSERSTDFGSDAETARLTNYPAAPKRIGAAENVSPSDPRQSTILRLDPVTGKLPTQQINPKTLLPITNTGKNDNAVAPVRDDAVVGRPRGGQ